MSKLSKSVKKKEKSSKKAKKNVIDKTFAPLNIWIVGTPGTGKTSFTEILGKIVNTDHAHQFNLVHLGEVIQDNNMIECKDQDRDTMIMDEDKVVDYFDNLFESNPKGHIIEYHSLLFDLLPEDVEMDIVVVLSSDNSVLGDRLEARGYSPDKISENIQAEIFQVSYDEALEYKNDEDHQGCKVIKIANDNRLVMLEGLTKLIATLEEMKKNRK